MKRILLYFLFLTGIFSVAEAQEQTPTDGSNKEQKIRALYAAYITQQLNLTEAEAQKFWPVHAQFDADLKAVSLGIPELERQQAQLNIKKKYQDKFNSILGSNRSNNFYRIDGEFRKKLVDELRKRRQQNNLNQRPRNRKAF